VGQIEHKSLFVWRNGKRVSSYTIDGNMFLPNVFIADDGSVYVSGTWKAIREYVPRTGWVYYTGHCYWKDGVEHRLTGPYGLDGYSSVETVTFVAGGDVYVACIVWRDNPPSSFIVLWKNGEASLLPLDADSRVSPMALFVSGDDVYVVGHCSKGAVLWKNGALVHLGGSRALSVFAQGDDVYVSGEEYSKNGVPHAKHADGDVTTAVLWKNGVRQALPSFPDSSAQSVFVSGEDVYVCGYALAGSNFVGRRQLPVLWKNGEMQMLPSGGHERSVATSVHVSGPDVYVAGRSDDHTPVLWKNGAAQALPVPK
jgi:uncharacterized membrane protein